MPKNDPWARARECAIRIPENGSMLEIGVWRGDNARRILAQHPTARLTLVDPWEVPPTGSSYAASGSSDSRSSQQTFEAHYREAVHKTNPYRNRCRIARLASAEAAVTLFKDERFDVIFIDADHSYDGCLTDILAWQDHARLWLGGHDYGKQSFPGVTKAVDELYPECVLGADSTWWVRKGKG